jgi:hypothetical protein
MKFIITESQRELISLLRRLNDPEMNDQMKSIVTEGFDYVSPCDHQTFETYLHEILYGSAMTLINSHIINVDEDKYETLEKQIYEILDSKFRNMIMKEYYFWKKECEDDN